MRSSDELSKRNSPFLMHFEHSICIFFRHQNPIFILKPLSLYATFARSFFSVFYYLFFLFARQIHPIDIPNEHTVHTVSIFYFEQ